MFKLIITACLSACLTAGYAQIDVPAASPAATISQQIGLGTVTVSYSRPSLKGRTMFGDRVPYGKVWRTGANKITTLQLSEPMTINGKALETGTYGLYSIPDQDSFTFIINKDANAWGAYDYKEANDVVRLVVKPERLNNRQKTETLTFEFVSITPTSATLQMRWETMAAQLTITDDADSHVMAQIKQKTADPKASTDTYFAAANYYLDTNRDLNQALSWANKVVEKSQEYWTYHLRAKIEAKLGNCKAARADAQMSLDMAKKANDDAYIKNNETILEGCKL
ncbi:hypothetical protein FAES_2617 [Fibrella aestuarina BUZ 2]|uniref:DUF2911 domain-containing protein n=1 Tax=Fibrella aestuarina BUZ 2 TaxID=1166018 RepID=I0K923_9BACT|nr:DUF2911 domain-containing protein [Fibrella aestuarina]CCH00626.1 hypothetical protein FAES_2617 [Fibrella aestuarina BUZ 2]